MNNTPQPLSEEQLQQIRTRITHEPDSYDAIDKRGGRGKYITRRMVEYPYSTGEYYNDARALLAEVERLKAAHKEALRETWRWVGRAEDVATELDEMASALDIDMPSDSGYVARIQRLARTLSKESEGSKDE